jgi:RNA polymerase sigma-70 factor (ECF subfamily)
MVIDAEKVLQQHSDMVYRLAFAQMRTKHDADDVFQDVFLALVTKSRRSDYFADDEHLKAWLIRATINRCKTLKTSAWSKRTTLNELEAVTYETPEQNDLSEYLDMLPGKYRNVIHLFYYEELPVAEIAELLDARESTVRAWLTRARAILRKKLGGHFHEEA